RLYDSGARNIWIQSADPLGCLAHNVSTFGNNASKLDGYYAFNDYGEIRTDAFNCRSFTNEIVNAYAYALIDMHVFYLCAIRLLQLPIYTIRTWSMIVLENVNSLVGRSAAPEYLQKLTYLCWNHHKAIRHIDTVWDYTFGSHYFIEVAIVLPAGMPLQEAHDIGESLQEKLELLSEIQRAFVHLDYGYSHKPEHAQALLAAI
ncbi:hypothetical protein RYX36_031955, partial [Vicia faba]